MKREEKIEMREQMIVILKSIIENHPVSDAAVRCSADNELFADTCNFVGLRYELSELVSTLQNMNKYSKLFID